MTSTTSECPDGAVPATLFSKFFPRTIVRPYPPFASRRYNATVAVNKDGHVDGIIEEES